MNKFLLRFCAFLIALILITGMTAYKLPVITASAAGTPVFSLEADVSSAKAGDIITVSLYIDNDSETAISAFDGDITFNSSHFSYIDFICPEIVKNKLTCLDFNAFSSSKISMTFADTTKSLIPSGTTHFLLLQLRFKVISPVAGNGQVICSMNSCYGGTTSYNTLPPAQLSLPVSPTQSTNSTSSTTESTTTTTKKRSSDARLRALSIAPGTLNPAFNPEFVAYSVSVEYEIATIRISATPNSTEAVASGIGIKDLAVGQNTFTITVTAEDGSIMQYGLVVYRAAETQPSTSTSGSSTTESTAPFAEPTDLLTITGYTEPTTPAPLPTASQPDKIIDGGNDTPSDTELIKIIGIIFAEVALFMFGFLAGFFLDKNIRKKNIAQATYGSLDRQMPRREPPYQPEYPDYGAQPDYQDYQPEYNDYQEYSDGYQPDGGFPQYNGYDSDQRYDEYGNPILDNAPYNDGFWEYGENNNDSYYH